LRWPDDDADWRLAQRLGLPVGKTTNVFMVVDAANNSNTCSLS
jgi:hypothetical protein